MTKRKGGELKGDGHSNKKQKLVSMACMMVDEKKHICESGAKELWKFAKDPRGKKTSDENLQTLRGILQSHRFTNNARRYLDSLVNRNITGVSAYKNIDGQRYDRVCLDFANQVCQVINHRLFFPG